MLEEQIATRFVSDTGVLQHRTDTPSPQKKGMHTRVKRRRRSNGQLVGGSGTRRDSPRRDTPGRGRADSGSERWGAPLSARGLPAPQQVQDTDHVRGIHVARK